MPARTSKRAGSQTAVGITMKSQKDAYYRSAHWRQLREAALQRDRNTCVVPGCGQRATIVDHIKARRDRGADLLANLRSLCRDHDNQVKERPNGKRANAGKLVVRGCDAHGMPLDPYHPWHRR